MLTWVRGMTIRAFIVAADRLHQFVEELLIPRLLALAQCSRHDASMILSTSMKLSNRIVVTRRRDAYRKRVGVGWAELANGFLWAARGGCRTGSRD